MHTQTTYTKARANFANLCNQAVNDCEPIIIKRRNAESVALIAVSELLGLEETVHLLRSSNNAQRLLKTLLNIKKEKVKPQSIESLRKELGLD